MLGVVSSEPFPIRRWLVDASPGLLGLSLGGKNAPHRDGLGYAFFTPNGQWRLFRFGPKLLAQNGIPGPIDSEALVLLAHARKSSQEYHEFRGAVHAHPFFHDGIFLCHNGTVRDTGPLGEWLGTDTRKVLLWLAQRWQPRTPEQLKECLTELLRILKDYTALNLLISDGLNLYALCAYTKDPDYFTLWVHESPGLVVVASEPADRDKSWFPFQNFELLTVSSQASCEHAALF